MTNNLYSIGIAATANDKRTLRGTISTLERDLRERPFEGSVETIICLNNHDREIEDIAQEIIRDYSSLRVSVTSSKPGLIYAQKRILQEAKRDSDFIVFYDADVSISSGTTRNFIRFMEANPEVKAGSGNQIAMQIDDFWYGAYNIIGLNPQLMTLRKYITGKDFAIRKEHYFVPEFMLTEDTFLSHYLISRFGKEAVQSVPGASVTYVGPMTLKDYFNKIRRLDLEMEKMFSHYPEFRELNHYFKKERIREEITKLSLRERVQLMLHDIILRGCKRSVRFSKAPIWVPLKSTKDENLFGD